MIRFVMAYLLLFGVAAQRRNYSWEFASDMHTLCGKHSNTALSPSFLQSYKRYCTNLGLVSNAISSPNRPQCSIGFTRPAQKITRTRTKTESCTIRGLSDRPGLWKTWQVSGLPATDSSKALANFLVSHSSRSGLSNLTIDVVFLGDSVNSQLAQYFMCDLLGSGVPGSGALAAAAFNHTKGTFTLSSSPFEPAILHVHNKQFNLPCIHHSNACPELEEALPRARSAGNDTLPLATRALEQITFDYVTHLLVTYSSPHVLRCSSVGESDCPAASSPSTDGDVYIVFNYGLHVHRRSGQWAFRGMARALVAFAATLFQTNSVEDMRGHQRTVRLLIRETSSQAFWFSTDGSFAWGQDSAHTSGYCCAAPKEDPFLVEWRNRLMVTELDRADPHWRTRIGWIPFFNDSVLLSDLREEYNYVTRKVDCTHFIYTPFAYDILWTHIKEAIESLP